MTIAIEPTTKEGRIRALKAKHPYLTPVDIANLTGEAPRVVRSALGLPTPKAVVKAGPRIEARGPLTAAQIAEKTGMPLSAAKLMVR